MYFSVGTSAILAIWAILSVLLSLTFAGNYCNVWKLLQLSEEFLPGISHVLTENSVWSLFFIFLLGNLVALWLFSAYLEFDTHAIDFSLKLIIFFFSVWGVIAGISLLQWALFWEIVGWISFRLISHWIDRANTRNSSFSAAGFNRVGDFLLVVFLVMGVLWLSTQELTSFLGFTFVFAISVFKSVNFITFLWLPEAMEGPTPVSSLLHSCTLVMAGIFIFMKFALVSPTISAIFGLFGIVIAALFSNSGKDAKKVIANSTILMVCMLWIFVLLGFSTTISLIALLHAAYKSAFFVVVGFAISQSNSSQENSLGGSTYFSGIAILAITIASAPKFSRYAIAKHSLSDIDFTSTISPLISVFLVSGVSIAWIFVWKLIYNFRFAISGFGFPVLPLFSALLSLSVISISLPVGNSVAGQTSGIVSIVILTFIWLHFSGITLANIGNNALTSDFESIFRWWFAWIATTIKISNSLGLFSVGNLGISAIFTWLFFLNIS